MTAAAYNAATPSNRGASANWAVIASPAQAATNPAPDRGSLAVGECARVGEPGTCFSGINEKLPLSSDRRRKPANSPPRYSPAQSAILPASDAATGCRCAQSVREFVENGSG